MLDPTISDLPRPRPRHCGRASVAATAVAALLLTGCTGNVAGPPAAAHTRSSAGVRTSADIVGFDDGFDHYVVTTVNDPTRPSVAAPAAAAPPPGTAAPDATVSDPIGAPVAGEPPAGLVPVTAVDATEQAALDHAEPGSLVVEDVHGLVGDPGRRYLRTLDHLYEIGIGRGAATEIAAPAVRGAAHSDPAIRDALDAVDGVVGAEIVGTGIIAVAAEPSADTGDITAVPGVTGLAVDVAFGLSTDTRQPLQWALENTGDPAQANGTTGVAGADTNADLAWSVTTGAGTVVAIIDSGVDLSHPDLAPNIWTNPGEQCGNGVDDDANGYVDDCRGWDFGDRDNDPNPAFGSQGAQHGTHVAGIVAGARNGTGIVGIAPDATILPVKVGDSAGRITMSSLAAAITYASRYADVINMSLGTSPGTPQAYVADLEAAVATAGRAGVTIVAAMGNDGVDISARPVWPASFASTYDHVIAVGASTNSDTRAYFSNTGTPLTVYAPGWAIMSSLPTTGWGFLYGTSMASPAVAGAAASVRAAGTATTPAQVRARLVATAARTGAGPRLDVAAAVGYVRPAEVPPLSVTLGGADAIVPDAPSTLTWNVATRDPSSAVALRLSVAARDGGDIGAVDGLDADLRTAAGDLGTLVTDARGEFPPVPVDTAALTRGITIEATLALPASEYAFVVELIDANGLVVSPAVANFVSVTTAPVSDPAATTTTTAATPVPTSPSAPTTGAPPAPGTPTSPSPSPPATTLPAGSSGGTGGTTAPGTTAPNTTAPNTTAPNSTAPSSTAPQPPAGSPTTAPAVPSTTAAHGTTTSLPPSSGQPSPTTTPTTPGAPTTPVPTTTLPPPDPVSDGSYRATAITPRSGRVDGGTTVTIDGVFPTSVPVYVWFGDSWSASVRANAAGNQVTVITPAVPIAGTRDVIIRFSTNRSFELRLDEAFAFVEETAPTTTAPPSGSGGGGSATTLAPSPTPPPATTTTTTAAPPGSASTTTAPTTIAPATRTLGRLTLRSVAPGSALSLLQVSAWPGTGCRTAACPGVGL